MSHANTTQKDLETAAKGIASQISISKRKLLEFEVLMSKSEIKTGKSKHFTKAKDLI
ncbi:MAG: hypothetical protein AAB914_02020 [Patescibacteria group bacterium]